MSTRSSFLLLGFFNPTTYAANCSLDQANEFADVMTPYSNCLQAAALDFCAPCRDEVENLVNFEFPDCTISGQNIETTFGQVMNVAVNTYNTQCGTEVGGSTGTGDDTTGTNGSPDTEDEPSETKVDDKSPPLSGAPGYSAAHYMLAILVPMAVLFL